MPRSVVVLSSDPDLFDHLRTAFQTDDRFIDAGDTLHCTSPLTNIYPVQNDPVEWSDWNVAAVEMPDPRTMTALIFECRSSEWVAEVGRLMSQALDSPAWFVDAANVAWPTDQVDPLRIELA